ncbi:MAG: hypothetical protein GF368_02430 [Candidatus Aenigmarchaeota archaeon]|nr:hypothetical protein [Candidatus Aenigmarchaeota archaeon]
MSDKEFPIDVKEKLPKLWKYSVLLVLMILANQFLLPLLGFFGEVEIILGYTAYDVLSGLFPLLSLFIIFKLSSIFFPLIDFVNKEFLEFLPGFEKVEERNMRRVLSDFVYIIIIILIGVALTPTLTKLTPYAKNVIDILEMILILFLIYDAGKTVYKMIERSTKNLNINGRIKVKSGKKKK